MANKVLTLSDVIRRPSLLRGQQHRKKRKKGVCPDCQKPMVLEGFHWQCVECGHEESDMPASVEAEYGF